MRERSGGQCLLDTTGSTEREDIMRGKNAVTWISRKRHGWVIIVLLVAAGCRSIAPYSQRAYEQAPSLKVEALALMERATAPYDEHEAAVEDLQTKVEKAYEYARNLPHNELTTRQWEILKSPERNLLGGFLALWREKGTLSPIFIREARSLVADAFDTISGLESGKIRPGDVQ